MTTVNISHPEYGDRTIAAVDFTKAWRDRGWLEKGEEPSEPEIQLLPGPPKEPELYSAAAVDNEALELINTAIDADELTELPTVGAGSAKIIFEHRPKDGYQTLDDLPGVIFQSPYRCDLEQIKAWK